MPNLLILLYRLIVQDVRFQTLQSTLPIFSIQQILSTELKAPRETLLTRKKEIVAICVFFVNEEHFGEKSKGAKSKNCLCHICNFNCAVKTATLAWKHHIQS